MAPREIEEIGATLHSLASPKMSPKELLKAVRERHPKASKKAIVRAAFYSIIANAGADPEKDQNLQAFAIAERGGE